MDYLHIVSTVLDFPFQLQLSSRRGGTEGSLAAKAGIICIRCPESILNSLFQNEYLSLVLSGALRASHIVHLAQGWWSTACNRTFKVWYVWRDCPRMPTSTEATMTYNLRVLLHQNRCNLQLGGTYQNLLNQNMELEPVSLKELSLHGSFFQHWYYKDLSITSQPSAIPQAIGTATAAIDEARANCW